MKRRNLRGASGRSRVLLGGLLIGALATVGPFASRTALALARGGGPNCADLMTLPDFPVTPTQIDSVVMVDDGATTANGVTLPAYCKVRGVMEARVGEDGQSYGTHFEVRLPIPENWNGRFMMQGGGGSEGSVPDATGSAGSLSPTLAHGWAVATQDGGHENSDLANNNDFFIEPKGATDQAYHSVDITTQTAKYLIEAYYGVPAMRSYFVGCSTGGRQGMVMSQHFPDHFDGIIAGDPVYNLQAINLDEIWGLQQIRNITPTPIPLDGNGNPILYAGFPVEDQELFQKALLQACDGLDGTVDDVIDNLPACHARFDPATYVFTDTGEPLQCAAGKTPTCLTPEQITAVKEVNRGPHTADGHAIRTPAGEFAHPHPDSTVQGYLYDGGFMTPNGMPSRIIGTPTQAPGDVRYLGQFGYAFISPPDPGYDALGFDFGDDLGLLAGSVPVVTYSTSLNVTKFVGVRPFPRHRHGHDARRHRRGGHRGHGDWTDISSFAHNNGKIIWYHGLSDPGPPVRGTILYYEALAKRYGGLKRAAAFSRLYLVPNMGHCRGGPSTDQFDMLTPLVDWVENGIAPGPVVASGTAFTSDPTARSRPLCPYPDQVRFVGPSGGDLADPDNYACLTPEEARAFDNPKDGHHRHHRHHHDDARR